MIGVGISLWQRNRSFSPAALFAAGEPGAWYDPGDWSTLFQDTAGTVPVTATGQTVARINDKSGRGNHRTQATAAQRPALQVDASGRYYLLYDGVDDMMTASIDMSTTDALMTVSGLRKTLDNIAQIFFEASAGYASTGVYALNAPAGSTPTVTGRSKGTGTTADALYTNAAVAAPVTFVALHEADISLDRSILRVNGAQVATSATDQGAGNYGNHTVYFGKRSTGSNPFNGREYGIIILGRAPTAAEITSAEAWMNSRTGAY
jgi:hypothetical protein